MTGVDERRVRVWMENALSAMCSRFAFLLLLSASAAIGAPPTEVVGSRHSHIYHRPTCYNARRIEARNLVS